MIEFSNKPPKWENAGTEPTDEEKREGYAVLDKVPAPYMNWQLHETGECIEELQNKLSNENTERINGDEATSKNITDHKNDKNNPHGVTKEQIGLDKVNNTADSEKAVAFASEANVARKVENPIIVRFKGGSTEGTNMFTFDGATSKSVNITPEKIGAAKDDLSNVDDVLKEKVEKIVTKGVPTVAAISADGETYTATVEGVTELYNGLEITIIPNISSTKAAVQFDLNGLGARNLRAKINGYNSGNSGTIAAFASWLGQDTPITIRYISKFDNWQTVDFSRPSATGLYGTIKPNQGGTGISDEEGITAGNFLVGNGTEAMQEKTPAQVLEILTGKDSISDLVVGGANWSEYSNHLAMHPCSNMDINELTDFGFYYGYTGMANAAIEGEISVIEVIPYSYDWILQRQTRLTDGKSWTRYKYSGNAWSNWAYFYTSAINDAAKIQSGSYTGTGYDTNGENIEMSLSFNFTPKVVIIQEGDSPSNRGVFVYNAPEVMTAVGNGATSDYYANVTWSGKILKWKAQKKTSNANLNNSGKKYYWVAIG